MKEARLYEDDVMLLLVTCRLSNHSSSRETTSLLAVDLYKMTKIIGYLLWRNTIFVVSPVDDIMLQ